MKRRRFFAALAAIAISPLAVAKLSPSDKMRNLLHKGRFDLTDLYISPESLEDMKNWGVDTLSEDCIKEILSP